MHEQPARGLAGLLAELKRRRVLRVAGVYLVAAWVLLQVADLLLPALHLPAWTFTFLVLLALLGFPAVLALAWVLEATPEGVRRAGTSEARGPARAALSAVALLCLGAGAWVALGGAMGPRVDAEGPLPHIAAQVLPPEDAEFFDGPGFAAVSPDGNRLALVVVDASGKQSLRLREVGALETREIEGTEGAEGPFWSPDGAALGYFAAGALWRIDLETGVRQRLCDAPSATGGAWGDDGAILFALDDRVLRVPAAGGACERVPLPEGRYRHPSPLPGGRALLWTGWRTTAPGILVLDPGDATIREIGHGASPVFVPPGWMLFVGDKVLFAQRFDPRRGRVRGEAVPIAQDVQLTAAGPAFAAARGTLVFRPRAEMLPSLVLHRDGAPPDTVREDRFWTVALAHQRAWAALGGFGLRLFDFDRGTSSLLDQRTLTEPVFSPGDSLLAYRNWCDLGRIRLADGADTLLLRRAPPRCFTPADWTRDGRLVLGTLAAGDTARFSQLWAYDVADGSFRPLLTGAANLKHPAASPDGAWLAYASDETGRPEVYVRPFGRPGTPLRVSTAGGRAPEWRGDGRELFYAAPGARLMVVDVAPGAELRVGRPAVLIDGGWTDAQGAVSPDGNKFMLPPGRPERVPLVIVHDWRARLQTGARVP